MAVIIRGDAFDLPLLDASVDLIVTSPPYLGLRTYDGATASPCGELGAETGIAEYLHRLWACTREMVRVLTPHGSLFVNLGDRYASRSGRDRSGSGDQAIRRARYAGGTHWQSVPEKSLVGLPWRYAIGCIDTLGLRLRAEIIWDKPNGIPSSVRDRVRRSHETWFHFVRSPRYYAHVDPLRQPHTAVSIRRAAATRASSGQLHPCSPQISTSKQIPPSNMLHPAGALPGSVWRLPTQPLRIPPELGARHPAPFPMSWPARLISAWAPERVCTACGAPSAPQAWCRCGAGTRRAVVADVFGGSGTTALVADVMDRVGVSVELSETYCQLAAWRTSDVTQRRLAVQARTRAAVASTPALR